MKPVFYNGFLAIVLRVSDDQRLEALLSTVEWIILELHSTIAYDELVQRTLLVKCHKEDFALGRHQTKKHLSCWQNEKGVMIAIKTVNFFSYKLRIQYHACGMFVMNTQHLGMFPEREKTV